MEQTSYIKLLDSEYKELLNTKHVEIHRGLGVTLYEKIPSKLSGYRYEMYILKHQKQDSITDTPLILCKLMINTNYLNHESHYIENPYGKLDEIVYVGLNDKIESVVKVKCSSSSILCITPNNLNAHGMGSEINLIERFLKTNSYNSLENLRFIIYCWYNEYTLLDTYG